MSKWNSLGHGEMVNQCTNESGATQALKHATWQGLVSSHAIHLALGSITMSLAGKEHQQHGSNQCKWMREISRFNDQEAKHHLTKKWDGCWPYIKTNKGRVITMVKLRKEHRGSQMPWSTKHFPTERTAKGKIKKEKDGKKKNSNLPGIR